MFKCLNSRFILGFIGRIRCELSCRIIIGVKYFLKYFYLIFFFSRETGPT